MPTSRLVNAERLMKSARIIIPAASCWCCSQFWLCVIGLRPLAGGRHAGRAHFGGAALGARPADRRTRRRANKRSLSARRHTSSTWNLRRRHGGFPRRISQASRDLTSDNHDQQMRMAELDKMLEGQSRGIETHLGPDQEGKPETKRSPILNTPGSGQLIS